MSSSVIHASGDAPGAGLAAREIRLTARQATYQRSSTSDAPVAHTPNSTASSPRPAVVSGEIETERKLVGDSTGDAALIASSSRSGWAATGGSTPASEPSEYSSENGTRNLSEASIHNQWRSAAPFARSPNISSQTPAQNSVDCHR